MILSQVPREISVRHLLLTFHLSCGKFALNPSFPGESIVTEPGIIHPNGQTVQDQVIHRVFRVAADLDREPMDSEHPKCLSIREAKLNKRFNEPCFHFGISSAIR